MCSIKAPCPRVKLDELQPLPMVARHTSMQDRSPNPLRKHGVKTLAGSGLLSYDCAMTQVH